MGRSRDSIFCAVKICAKLKSEGRLGRGNGLTTDQVLAWYQKEIDSQVPPTRIPDTLKYLELAKVVGGGPHPITNKKVWWLSNLDYDTRDPFETKPKEGSSQGSGGSSTETEQLKLQLKTVSEALAKFQSQQEENVKKEVQKAIASKESGWDHERKDYEEKLKHAGQPRIVEVQIKEGNKVVRKLKESFHAEFPKLLSLAKARMNIFLYGPTGCGKTHICFQLAKALGLDFAFVSCSGGMSEVTLSGRLLPIGEQGQFGYVESEFVRCYEKGGVFLFDELDAADPNVLILINSALANDRLAIPTRIKKPYATKHKDFVCVAAANTAGTNADRMYNGRTKLDASTLDRFQVGKIKLDYDRSVEEALCPDDELRTRCWKIRQAIEDHRLERAMSTRFMRDAYQMKVEAEWTMEMIDASFFTGWRADEISKVKSSL